MPDLTGQLPSSLRARARWERLGPSRVPVMLVHPDWNSGSPAPVVLWMHGRTVDKETDPGRFLRWMRVGIGSCSIDLAGHGQRFDEALQKPDRAFDVVAQMIDEIDVILEALETFEEFDLKRLAIGGMSAGGMAALSRLTRPHGFLATSVEGTSGSWEHQRSRAMFRHVDEAAMHARNPMEHLETWQEIPIQAFHSKLDEWMLYEGQHEFIETLRARYTDPNLIELIAYDQTGAPYEHIGFGRYSGKAKNQQAEFFARWLTERSGLRH